MFLDYGNLKNPSLSICYFHGVDLSDGTAQAALIGEITDVNGGATLVTDIPKSWVRAPDMYNV